MRQGRRIPKHMDTRLIQKLHRILHESKNLCVFTGAGISVPSGIPDFRSADGLYNRESGLSVPPEQIISRSFFDAHPTEFYSYYKKNMLFLDAKPNETHRYFAGLESPARSVGVVTQNIDGLHTAAGSTEVYELHGSVHRNFCMRCKKRYDARFVAQSVGVPHCSCGGVVKPDVVLYEEPLDEHIVRGAVDAIRRADTLVVIGTSLVVYPAASFLHYFGGEHLVLINRSRTALDGAAELAFYEDVTEVVRALQAFEKTEMNKDS